MPTYGLNGKRIARGRPLIAGFSERFETRPVGGPGLP